MSKITLDEWVRTRGSLTQYATAYESRVKFEMYADLTQMGMPRRTAFSLIWGAGLWELFKDDGMLSQYDCTPGGPNAPK